MKLMKLAVFVLLLQWATIGFSQTNTLKFSDLPEAVQQDVKSNYKKYSLVNAESLRLKTGTQVFRVEVQKKSKMYRLTYSAEGVLLDKNKRKSYTYTGPDDEPGVDETGPPVPTL
jgi:hypothetical protein